MTTGKPCGWIAAAFAALCLGTGVALAALPEGATPLAYIQGSGYTYLDTGWTLHPNEDVFEAVVELTDAGKTAAFWSTRDFYNHKSCTMFYFGNSYFRSDYADSYQSEFSRNVDIVIGMPYKITVSNGTTVVSNGARVDVPPVAGFTTTPVPLVLFATSTGGAVGNHRLHSFKIWRNGVLVRDFVPVRTSNGVVTLADAVDGGVLTPLGSAYFIAGDVRDMAASPFAADVPPQLSREGAPAARPALAVTDSVTGNLLLEGVDYTLDFERYGSESSGRVLVTPTIGSAHAREPALEVQYDILSAPPPGYTRLEYVQGNGGAYWVTDYLPQPVNDEVEVDFAFTELKTIALFCSRTSWSSGSWSFCYLLDGSTGRLSPRLDYGATQNPISPSSTYALGGRYHLTVANKIAQTSNGHDITVPDSATTLQNAGDKLAIFAFYAEGTSSNLGSYSTQRLYRFAVRRSGELIHDWVPVLTPQGVVTLYDLVENKELAPKGTGSFIAGPAVKGGVEIASIPVQTLPVGGTCEPAPVVTQAGTGVRLAAGTDYTVSYANNGQAGLATLTVTGAGYYAGAFSVTVPFSITPSPPSGVTRLDYIQGDGAASLLTDWTINPQTDRVEAEIELTDLANAAIWCAREASDKKSFTLFRLANDTFRYDYGTYGYYSNQHTFGWQGLFPVGKKTPIVVHGADFAVGDVRVRRTTSADFTEAGGPLMLFASYGSASSLNATANGSRHRLCEFSVYRSGRLVRHWVPVRTAGGVTTLCELMTGTVLEPRGGSFVAGPVKADFDVFVADQAWDGEHRTRPSVAVTNRTTGVELTPGVDYTVRYENRNAEGWARAVVLGAQESAYAGQGTEANFRVIRELPKGYRRLEWLAGDGFTALKTGYVARPPTDTLTIDFELRDKCCVGGIVCARAAGSANSWSLCWQAGAFRFDCHTNSCNWTLDSIITAGMRYAMKMSGATASAACESSKTAPVPIAEAGGPMMLLCYYANPDNMAPKTCALVRVYSCTVVRSGELIHDWVPVVTPEGDVTLYDRVVGEPLELVGAGRLIAGPLWEHEGPVEVPPGLQISIQ